MKKSEWVGRLYFRTPRCVGNSHKRCGLVNFGRANDQWRCVSVKRLGHDWICATKIRCLSCLIGSGWRANQAPIAAAIYSFTFSEKESVILW